MNNECGFCKGTKVEPGIPGPCVWCEEVGAAPVEPVVQRFSAVALRFATSTAKDYVSGADFDRVTAERDAALESIGRLNDKVSCMSAHVLAYKLSRQRLLGRARARELLISELQQRLTAADERADVLEGLLRRSQNFVAFVHKCVRRNGEYAPLHRQEMDELNRDLSDYVEPGVPVCEQCRGEGRVGGPATDEGGGKNCPACDGTGVIEPATEGALKPAEGGGDDA